MKYKEQDTPKVWKSKIIVCPECKRRATHTCKLKYSRRTPPPMRYKCRACYRIYEPEEVEREGVKCNAHGWYVDLEKNRTCPQCEENNNIPFNEFYPKRGCFL